MEPTSIKIKLDPANGFNPKADSLVLERVYPTRWISPMLYKSGETVSIPLDGFETAVYEIYSLADVPVPLLAGRTFDVLSVKGNEYKIKYYETQDNTRLLNPSIVSFITIGDRKFNPMNMPHLFTNKELSSTIFKTRDLFLKQLTDDQSGFIVHRDIDPSIHESTIAILLKPDSSIETKTKPTIMALIDDKEISMKTEPQEGKSQWYTVELPEGKDQVVLRVKPGKDEKEWRGFASIWITEKKQKDAGEVMFSLKNEPKEKLMPPLPWSSGEIRENVKLGSVSIIAK